MTRRHQEQQQDRQEGREQREEEEGQQQRPAQGRKRALEPPQTEEAQRAEGEPSSEEEEQEVQPRRRTRRRQDVRAPPAAAPGSPSPSTATVQGEAGEECSEEEGEVVQGGAQAADQDVPELSLQVLWTSVSGRTKLTQLPLVLMPRWDCTSGLHKRLVTRIFSEHERPSALSCAQYLQFNTSEECLNFPMDVVNTRFRLVAAHEGWQYVIHEAPQQPPGMPPDFLHVVSIEFETVARVIGHLGFRLPMIAYPIVAIHKAKLQEAVSRMRTDPGFKGIL